MLRQEHRWLNDTLIDLILQGVVAPPRDISSLYDPSQHPRHNSHYKFTIALHYLPSFPFSADVLGEADLARKTSLIFEALLRFMEHAQLLSR